MHAALIEGPCYSQTGILVTAVVPNEDRWHSRGWGGTKELHQMDLFCQSLKLLGKTPGPEPFLLNRKEKGKIFYYLCLEDIGRPCSEHLCGTVSWSYIQATSTPAVKGSQLFNCLPVGIRNITGKSVGYFKRYLDNHLKSIPDQDSIPIMLPTAEVYFYPWHTCYTHHMLNSLGNIHPFTRFKALQVIREQLPSLSISRYSFMAEWTEAPVSSPVGHARQFLMNQLDYAGLEPTILWLGDRRANHLAITTQYSRDGERALGRALRSLPASYTTVDMDILLSKDEVLHVRNLRGPIPILSLPVLIVNTTPAGFMPRYIIRHHHLHHMLSTIAATNVSYDYKGKSPNSLTS